MSYSGFTEQLCVNGHYSAHDVWGDEPLVCAACGSAFHYCHGVDQTNGYDESHASTCRAPKEQIGSEDIWQEDHLGNIYATRRRRYAPLGDGVWVKVNSKGQASPPYPDDLAIVDRNPEGGNEVPSRSDESAGLKGIAQRPVE